MDIKSRKELKESYKQQKFRSGVFRIMNRKNGKFFIGSSRDLEAKWRAQEFQLNMGSHQNTLLQQEWKVYGPENFVYEILEEIKKDDVIAMDEQRMLKNLEKKYLDQFQPFHPIGYHIRKL